MSDISWGSGPSSILSSLREEFDEEQFVDEEMVEMKLHNLSLVDWNITEYIVNIEVSIVLIWVFFMPFLYNGEY